eukprot:Opistho-2@80539
MDVQQALVAAAVLLVWGGAVWGAALWWFGRKLKRALAGQARLEKARHFAAQQAAQARKQIESLQQEMGELRQAAKGRGANPAAHRVVPAAPLGDAPSPPPSPSNDAFADTQVLMPRKI